ncbi:MAG: mannonate dehydratase [Clostridia bacterium]|nr:mannonate dehydratase [Clostridia bacterium]
MKLTFRWYGQNYPVTLEKISQMPTMDGIVSAVYDIKPGGVRSEESIEKIKKDAESHNLKFEVVESVPIPENIKLGKPNAPELIGNYCKNIRRLSKVGVKCICYNFMPVFD